MNDLSKARKNKKEKSKDRSPQSGRCTHRMQTCTKVCVRVMCVSLCACRHGNPHAEICNNFLVCESSPCEEYDRLLRDRVVQIQH